MFSTIWMWTHEWSDIPSRRVALTAETCHHAFTCVVGVDRVEQALEAAVAARRDLDADVGQGLARRAGGLGRAHGRQATGRPGPFGR